MRIPPLCAALLMVVAAAGPARAYEDQLTVGLGAGYAHAASSLLPQHGAFLDVTVSSGIGPLWSLRGHASYALHPGDDPLHAALVGGDVLYLIDVLELVPFFGAGAGAIARVQRDDLDLDATLQLVVGLDYLISRTLTLELELRPHLLLSDLERDPFYGTAGVALLFMFDS